MSQDDQRPTIDWNKYRALTLERQDNGILLITTSEPETQPVQTAARRHWEVAQLWRDFADDPELRVAVVTGRGELFWQYPSPDEMFNDPGNYDRIVTLIKEGLANVHGMVNCDKPIVSAINGEAMGTGLVIALLADVSVAAEDAHLLDGHIPNGLAAGDLAVMIWPLLCGMAKAKYYLLASEDLTGKVAERIGLVSVAVPRAEVLDRAMEIAQQMAVSPQHALRWTKRSLNHWLRTATPAFEASIGLEAMSFFGPDLVEALNARVENRKPNFAEPVPW